MQYEIKKNIPLPPRTTPSVWPWPRMEIGDCVEIGGDADHRKLARLRAHAYGNATNKKFATRTVGDVLRVWRTA